MISLQTVLKEPKYKDIMAINTVIKRLKSPGERFGLYYRRLRAPLRCVSVSDASAANKTSNFATEGTAVLIMEDRVSRLRTDASDFVCEEQVQQIGGITPHTHPVENPHLHVSESQMSESPRLCPLPPTP